jgi:hypothetical protein
MLVRVLRARPLLRHTNCASGRFPDHFARSDLSLRAMSRSVSAGTKQPPTQPPAARPRTPPIIFNSKAVIEQGCAHLRAADARLAGLIAEHGAPDRLLAKTSSCFTSLAKAIIYQQLAGTAAAAIYARFLAACGVRASHGSCGRRMSGRARAASRPPAHGCLPHHRRRCQPRRRSCRRRCWPRRCPRCVPRA